MFYFLGQEIWRKHDWQFLKIYLHRTFMLLQFQKQRSVIKRPTNGITSTTGGQTSTASGQTNGQTSTTVGRRVLRVDKQVLRVNKRVLRVEKWVLQVVCFDRIALGLLSVGMWRLAGLSVTLGLSSIKRPDVLARQGTVMLCLYYYVFLMSSYILKMFLLAMFGKLITVLLESSLCFETAVKQFKTS